MHVFAPARPDASLLRLLRLRRGGNKSVGTSYPRRPHSFCRRHVSATIPVFARRTFADGEGGRLAAVGRGQARPGRLSDKLTLASIPRHGRILYHPDRGAEPPLAFGFRQIGQPDLFPIVGTIATPLVSRIRAVATRQGQFPGDSVMRRGLLVGEPLRPSSDDCRPFHACLLDNVRQVQTALGSRDAARTGTTSKKRKSPTPVRRACLWHISPLLPYTPYTSHHAVTRSAIEPAATRFGRAATGNRRHVSRNTSTTVLPRVQG